MLSDLYHYCDTITERNLIHNHQSRGYNYSVHRCIAQLSLKPVFNPAVCQMHVILSEGHLMGCRNMVTSIVTCLPNGNPWPYGIDFHAALLPPRHRVDANMDGLDWRSMRSPHSWLIHSLSGVITVPSTTMSRGETWIGRAKPMPRDEWTDSFEWEEYAKICAAERAQSHVCQSTERTPEPFQRLLLLWDTW